MNVYNCFSRKLAGFLLMKGFDLIGLKSDLKMTGRSVYLFRDGELLRKAISSYKNKYKKV
jgi:hypothetical protein